MEIFQARLAELKGDMTVSAFARLCDIPQPSMDKYMKGRIPPIDVARQICSRLGVSADWLLGLSDERGGHGTASGAMDDGARAKALEAENAALKGEIRGLRFALDAAMRGGAKPTLYDSVFMVQKGKNDVNK